MEELKETDINMEELAEFRRRLHRQPELSGNEHHTPQLVLDFLEKSKPDDIYYNLGGNGLALVYRGKKEGPRVLLRCELDALPIREDNALDYRSIYDNVSHKCGHDGHMAIIAGVGKTLQKHRPLRGEVVLLFQHAEETGEGAYQILQDSRFEEIKPDFAFALHNLPRVNAHKVLINEHIFASASRGMEITLRGATSHAAHPEKGRTPALAVSEIIKGLTLLPKQQDTFKDFVLVTVVHAFMGAIAYGTSPGYAEVRATLRSHSDKDMERLIKEAELLVKNAAHESDLEVEIRYLEEFPSTRNDPEMVNIVRKAATAANLKVEEVQVPFRWSEDFGHFSKVFPVAFFGLGAGETTPDLHNPDYDFPDDIISSGVAIFNGILRQAGIW